ncbi:class I SAM-dependent methyltransferase [Flavobacterium sp.]|uniref:class I SAM-dependent methyltransferase n=1 Tax=Flavobacterium sp. TaxID=239 RepID=UPI0039E23AE9
MKLIQDNPVFKPLGQNFYTAIPNVTGAAYDDKAKMYERLVGSKLYNRIFWGTSPSDYTRFAENAILSAKGNALDVGCGGLVQTASVYTKAQADCYLLDQSTAMLEIGKKRLEKACGNVPENIVLLQADAFQIPFADQTFDTVFSFGMIHLFADKPGFLSEVLRVLKTGQRFYFTSLTNDRRFSSWYLSLLQQKNEIAAPMGSKEITALFNPQKTKIEMHNKGSMVFISGVKTAH